MSSETQKNDSYPFPPRLLTWKEAAYYLGVKSINTVKKLAFAGEIKVCKHNAKARPRVVRDSLDKYIDRHTIDYSSILNLAPVVLSKDNGNNNP